MTRVGFIGDKKDASPSFLISPNAIVMLALAFYVIYMRLSSTKCKFEIYQDLSPRYLFLLWLETQFWTEEVTLALNQFWLLEVFHLA